MTNLFRNVHALIKKRRPITDFIWMCELDEMKGVDIWEAYRNEKQVLVIVPMMVGLVEIWGAS